MTRYPWHALCGAAFGLVWVITIRQQLELVVWLAGQFR